MKKLKHMIDLCMMKRTERCALSLICSQDSMTGWQFSEQIQTAIGLSPGKGPRQIKRT